MLTYPAVFAFLNIFLEDLNRISGNMNVGDTVSQLLAPFVFLGSILFGFYCEAKGSGTVLETGAIMYLSCIGIKWFKEFARGRKYTANYWLIIVGLVSITVAFMVQENIFIKDLPCDPKSLF